MDTFLKLHGLQRCEGMADSSNPAEHLLLAMAHVKAAGTAAVVAEVRRRALVRASTE